MQKNYNYIVPRTLEYSSSLQEAQVPLKIIAFSNSRVGIAKGAPVVWLGA